MNITGSHGCDGLWYDGPALACLKSGATNKYLYQNNSDADLPVVVLNIEIENNEISIRNNIHRVLA
jgi:hypothetical protein